MGMKWDERLLTGVLVYFIFGVAFLLASYHEPSSLALLVIVIWPFCMLVVWGMSAPAVGNAAFGVLCSFLVLVCAWLVSFMLPSSRIVKVLVILALIALTASYVWLYCALKAIIMH
jgi:hypothetical protein